VFTTSSNNYTFTVTDAAGCTYATTAAIPVTAPIFLILQIQPHLSIVMVMIRCNKSKF
jgi:hypothetical protein